MPITSDASPDIDAAVPRIKALAGPGDRFLFLGTRTNRSRQTAQALRDAIDPGSPEVKPAWGLRNPDIYLAGARVEMGSKPEFFASQCDFLEMTPEAVLEQSFYNGFLNAPDRIEYWVHHSAPPGEDAKAVASRVLHFARSFRAAPLRENLVVAAVTHSPVMRAVLTKGLNILDPGEPNWLEEIVLEVTDAGVGFKFRTHTGTLRS